MARSQSPSGHSAQAQPSRQFDATQPLSAARQDYPDSEDPALTAYLERLLADYFSKLAAPVPERCPGCGSAQVRAHCRPNQFLTLPQFKCTSCKHLFNRLAGTPLARLQRPHRIPAFIRLLSQQISLEEAAKRLRMGYEALSNWTARFRELLLLHDPSGQWEARVRLGMRFQFVGRCIHCTYEGPFRHAGVALSGERMVICRGCSRHFAANQLVGEHCVPDAMIVHDPMHRALRQRGDTTSQQPASASARVEVVDIPQRKAVPGLPPLPALPVAQAGRFDLPLPLTKRDQAPAAAKEDPRLTRFLEAAIATVFSQDCTPPACPRCGSDRTSLATNARRGCTVPQFVCRHCGRCLTRLVGTPLARLTRKDALPAFVRLLSQHRPIADAAQVLALDAGSVSTWIRKFRIWLLQLDPTGIYEGMVKLGMRPPSAVRHCSRCGKDGTRRSRCKYCGSFVRQEEMAIARQEAQR